jgi:hypothetical protein
MPPRNPKAARYVVEIRNAAGSSLLLTSVDWTDSERNLAMSEIMKLIGFKTADPAKRPGNNARGGDRSPRAKATQKT